MTPSHRTFHHACLRDYRREERVRVWKYRAANWTISLTAGALMAWGVIEAIQDMAGMS